MYKRRSSQSRRVCSIYVQLGMIWYMEHERITAEEQQMVQLFTRGRQQSLTEKAMELGPKEWSSVMMAADRRRREGYAMRSDILSRGNSMSKDIEAQMCIACSQNCKYPWMDNMWDELAGKRWTEARSYRTFNAMLRNLDSVFQTVGEHGRFLRREVTGSDLCLEMIIPIAVWMIKLEQTEIIYWGENAFWKQ